jgi:hypothetical protein
VAVAKVATELVVDAVQPLAVDLSLEHVVVGF